MPSRGSFRGAWRGRPGNCAPALCPVSSEPQLKNVRGEFIGGPFDGLPAMLNGFYEGRVIVLVCDYTGRYAHIRPEVLPNYFKPTPV